MNMLRNYLLSGATFQAAGEGAGGGGAAPGGAAPGGAAPGCAAPGAGDGKGAEWYASFGLEQAQIDYLNAKGIKEPKGLLKIAQDFEAVARDRNVIPKPDTSKPEALANWEGWETLGWVKDAAKYTPKEPTVKEGQIYDPTMFKDFVGLAHEARIPVGAVERVYQGMFDKMQERINAIETAAKTDAETAKTKLETTLRGKWGDKFDANSDLAKRAMTALGVDKSKQGALEAAMGDLGLVEFFHTLGEKLGEDALKGGNNGGTPAMTPTQARQERLKLESNPEWMKIFQDQRHPLYKEHVEQRQRLINLEAQAQAA